MKWFKHETDSHTNLKLQAVIDKFGLEAFGYYWICVELVGLQSDNFKLKSEKNWKNYIKKFVGLEIDKQEMYLEFFSEINLIDKKALKLGTLFIPKIDERSDDYSKFKRRVSEVSTKKLRLEESREEEIRIEENREDKISFDSFWKIYPKKVGKGNAKKLWDKLSSQKQVLAIEDIPLRAEDSKWKAGFIKDPERYIKYEQWGDEIIKDKSKIEVYKNKDPGNMIEKLTAKTIR